MQGLFVALLIVAFPAILLIASRSWRAGHLSDRAMTRLVVGLTPTLVFAFGLVQGSSLPFAAAMAALLLVPGLALRGFVFELFREQRSR